MHSFSMSVLIATYNQEKYVKKAVNSVLEQDLSYVKEIVICDDGSSDGTLDIIREYQTKYPDLIKIVINTNRANFDDNTVYPDIKYEMIRKNYIKGIQALSDTDYTAILEGDDYWYSGKIKYFADLLEQNPYIKDDYVLLFHKYQVLKNSDLTERHYLYDKMTEITVGDCIENYQINNLSCAIYKTEKLKTICTRFRNTYGVDYPLNIMVLQHGKGLFIPETFSVYRESENGSWSNLPKELQIARCILRRIELKHYFDKSYNKYFDKTIKEHIGYLLNFEGM